MIVIIRDSATLSSVYLESASPLRSRRLPDRITWIVGLGSTAALGGQSGSPWMVNALTGPMHYPTQTAGLMVTAEMLAMGGVMIAVSPIVHRLPAKAAAALALATIGLAQIASTMAGTVSAMTVARVVAGLGFGLLFAIASAFGARSADPPRTFGNAGVIALLIGVTINPMLGTALDRFGQVGVFGGLALFSLGVGLPMLLLRFPPLPAAIARESGPGVTVSALAAACVMATMALLSIATNGVFTFLTTIAGGVGLHGSGLGAGMAVVSLVSALGGVAAGLLGNRQGMIRPLAAGLAAIAAALFALTWVRTPSQFWVVFTAVVTLYWFLWPFIFGLAVAVDPKGRIAAATGSAKILAGGVGSGVFGGIVANAGLHTAGMVAAGLCGLSLTVALAFLPDSMRQNVLQTA